MHVDATSFHVSMGHVHINKIAELNGVEDCIFAAGPLFVDSKSLPHTQHAREDSGVDLNALRLPKAEVYYPLYFCNSLEECGTEVCVCRMLHTTRSYVLSRFLTAFLVR